MTLSDATTARLGDDPDRTTVALVDIQQVHLREFSDDWL